MDQAARAAAPGLDQPVMQWGKQEAEAEVKVSSSHENKAMEKQCGSQEEEPVVMQRCEDPNEAEVMQRSGDEAKNCPGLDHPGQSKKEWPKHDASQNR